MDVDKHLNRSTIKGACFKEKEQDAPRGDALTGCLERELATTYLISPAHSGWGIPMIFYTEKAPPSQELDSVELQLQQRFFANTNNENG